MRNNKKTAQTLCKSLTASALALALGTTTAFAADGNSTVKGASLMVKVLSYRRLN